MADSKQERILVVEDESHLAEGLKLNLTLEGYEVRIAADGSSALQQWKEWRPDRAGGQAPEAVCREPGETPFKRQAP